LPRKSECTRRRHTRLQASTDFHLTASPCSIKKRKLSDQLNKLTFKAPITHTYNPLDYAWGVHDTYVRKFAANQPVLLVGMNPGPFGMAQTGVPFGDVAMVRDWMLISDADGPVGTPARENPNRKIAGFACPRSEVREKLEARAVGQEPAILTAMAEN